jgi:hypothetical protein
VDGQHTLAVTLETSDEALAEIKAFADREQLSAAQRLWAPGWNCPKRQRRARSRSENTIF